MGCLMASLPNVRLPLAHLEALVVLLDSVQDFGVAMCHPRALMEYVKGPQGLGSSNPKVRSAAIAMYVVAHEKELRESAINTLVAVYLWTDGEHVDKFFGFAGITTQRGIDLVNARLKHFLQVVSRRQRRTRSRQGFGFGRASTTVSATPTKTAKEQQVESVQGDDDVDMSSPPDEVD
ncbi:hypothetical protein PsorP6_003003 [Peronosclerospora sorghi]|uniref:Uncharacterized protein n=1 Tax=Peronosclerospora sorghi TaxID=230839 RepID=A0ACC0VN92_9STRA|nr:hypothetical protein PsorP6_003003 [Peronosclerospora sorghi]